MYPYQVERKAYHKQEDAYIPVPCGRCPECLKRRASVWGLRLRKEEERNKSALFVTLTYDTQYVPISKNGFMTLDYRDVQKFFKRLRKPRPAALNKEYPIRYYVCGEYGSQRKRPHYHLILFNTDELSVLKAWVHPQTYQPYGHVEFGTVTGKSISYTIKYLNKGAWQPMHKNDDRYPEFSNMSKGLGQNYLTPAVIKHHRDNLEKAYVTIEDGLKVAMPRYYKNKIFQTELSPTQLNHWLVLQHPSILIHLSENQLLIDKQNQHVKELVEARPPLQMTDRELHESRKNAIHNFKRKHLERGDI